MGAIDAGFLAELQQSAVDYMTAVVRVYSRVVASDAGGSPAETWPGPPRLTLPARVQADERIPYTNQAADTKQSVSFWNVKVPVVYAGQPVVIYNTDLIETTDAVTGVLLRLKVANVYDGRSEQGSIDVYCQEVV